MRSSRYVAVLLFAAAVAFAATTPKTARAAEASEALRPGSWAIELNREYESVGLSSGNQISLKRQSSERTAFRLSVGADFSRNVADGGTRYIPPDTTAPYYDHVYQRSYSVTLNWVRYFHVSGSFAAQLGLGPTARWSSSNDDYSPYKELKYSSSSSSSEYGIEANLGVEWFFANRFSLGGRVGIVAATGTSKSSASIAPAFGTRQIRSLDSDISDVFSEPALIVLTGYF